MLALRKLVAPRLRAAASVLPFRELARRDLLRGKVDHLRSFESTFRTNLANHLQSQIKALTERLLNEALTDIDAPVQGELRLTQEDPLIRSSEDYADLFNLGAQYSAALPPLKEPAT